MNNISCWHIWTQAYKHQKRSLGYFRINRHLSLPHIHAGFIFWRAIPFICIQTFWGIRWFIVVVVVAVAVVGETLQRWEWTCSWHWPVRSPANRHLTIAPVWFHPHNLHIRLLLHFKCLPHSNHFFLFFLVLSLVIEDQFRSVVFIKRRRQTTKQQYGRVLQSS